MRYRLTTLLPVLAAVLYFSVAMPTSASACAVEGEYSPRDFSGIWFRMMGRTGPDGGGDCGFGPAGSNPPLTAAGIAVIKDRIPTGDPRHPAQKKVDDPALSNDPALTCNPKGFPQMVVDTAHDHHQVIMTADRMFQMWQEERNVREIWLDGREVPSGSNLRNLGTSWYGNSVGHWEGNVLVVETVGLDETAWLDIYGFPKSADAKITERFWLTEARTLNVQLTLHDPKYYTADWTSDVKRFRKENRDGPQINNFGWYGIYSSLVDLICAPKNNNGPRGLFY